MDWRGIAGEDATVGGCWGRRLGELRAVSEVGVMGSPAPFEEASP